jgi:integrase
MARTNKYIYRQHQLQQIYTVLGQCVHSIQQTQSIQQAWDLLTNPLSGLHWTAVMASKTLHFLCRGVGLRPTSAGSDRQRSHFAVRLAGLQNRNSTGPTPALVHLRPMFGARLLLDIEPTDVRKYQKKRIGEGAAPRTVNIEAGFLRSVMGKSGWARLQEDEDDQVKFLPEPESIGRKLPPDEEAILLRECGNSRSRLLFTFVTLALESGARKNVIRTLRWKWIDFANECIQFGRDKTPAGTGRIIPLNKRALEVLKFWAAQFPNREGDHFVFPAKRYGAAGDVFENKVYATDPTKPIASIKEAWEFAKKRAGVKCRFHDLKHTAVSRMLDAGVPIAKVAKIVGWSPSTMVKMAARYGHFTVAELRPAVETITSPGIPGIEEGYPRNPPQSDPRRRQPSR